MGGSDLNWLAPLERHRERRRQGVPTVTVMVGQTGAAEWIWKEWRAAESKRYVVAAHAEQLVGGWLGDVALLERLRAAIGRELAKLERISAAELGGLIRGRSTGQLEALAQERATQLDLSPDWVRWALGLARAKVGAEVGHRRVVAMLAGLLGALPALLVRPASTDVLAEVSQRLFEISEEVPEVDLGLAVDEGALPLLWTSVPARLVSSLTEGLIALEPRPGGASVRAGTAIEYDAEVFARSRAERMLYEELQRRARTRGLFALNVDLDAEPPMEVDLLCEELRIAIEIDGYYHFRDSDGYRRDRRKDVRLQELGYLVVRVLATDIDGELAHVLESIDRVVSERQKRRAR